MKKRLFLPSLQDILFLVVFSIAFALGPRMLNIDGDLPRHILVGKIIIETGTIPTVDIFSHVMQGQPLILHEWLADVIFYGFYSLLGLNGIVLLAALLMATTFTLSYAFASSTNGVKLPSLLLVLFGAAASSLHWITRPHLFSMFFLAIFLIWLDKLRRGQRKNIWFLPILMVIWCNVHAEFIAGFLVLGAYCAGWVWDYIFNRQQVSFEFGKRLGVIVLLTFIASLLSPTGLRIWETVFNYINNSFLISHISETQPPDFTNPKFAILLGLIAFSIALLAIGKNRIITAQALILAGFTVLSLTSARNIHLYGVVVPLTLAELLKGSMELKPLKGIETIIHNNEPYMKLSKFIGPTITIIVIVSLLLGGFIGNDNIFSPMTFPVEAVNWLEDHPQSGNMFNAFIWGGYILYRMWPSQLPFFDSQTDFYGDITSEYKGITTLSDDWQAILEKHDVTWAIIPPDWPLVDALMSIGWSKIYLDNTTIILSENPSP